MINPFFSEVVVAPKVNVEPPGCSDDIGKNVNQSTDLAGNVLRNPPNTRASDSAFVEFKKNTSGTYLFTADESKIYRGNSLTYNVLGKITSPNTNVGSAVKMMGWATQSLSSGTINLKNVNVSNTNCGGTLTNQVRATYASQSGDSGAPVFSTPDFNNNVNFYGIHVGRLTVSGISYAIYSPWEGIKSDLNLN